MAACNAVFRTLNENTFVLDQNELLHLSYQAFTPQHLICDNRLVQFQLNSFDYTFYQVMIPCPGIHNPVQTNPELDTFIDEIHISYGFKKNQIIIYKRIRAFNPGNDFHILQDNIHISWNNLVPVLWGAFMMPNTFELSYTEKEFKVQMTYVREWNNT